MKFDWKTWIKNKNNYVVLILIGVLIMVMLIPTDESGETEGEKRIGQGEVKTASDSYLGENLEQAQTYCQMLEEKLEQLLCQIEGVGSTSVMITLQYSEEKIVETERTTNTQETNESDASGGTRQVSSLDESINVVYQGSGNDSIPYVIKTQTPKVQGVMVVAQGAGVGEIDLKITQAVQALLGVEAHKIAIAKMETQ